MWVQSYDFFFISSLSATKKDSTETNIFRNIKEPLLTRGPPRSLRRLRRLLGGPLVSSGSFRLRKMFVSVEFLFVSDREDMKKKS